jgi:ribose 5-phosphate isomerase B
MIASVHGSSPITLTPTMRVAIGSDHAGFQLKGDLCTLLDELRIEYRDFGTFDTQPVDYPDFIAPVARAVARGDYERGIVLGGSGTGEAIVANKVRGIRCVEAADPVTARLGRQHNDANMLSMGARIIGREVALACVEGFMTADFEGGRHARRVDKIRALESDELS